MSITSFELKTYLDNLLRTNEIADYCPNGLQVEGSSLVKKIVTGVTASQALIDAAIAKGADTLLVHHGYFWKGENQPIVGMKKRRIASLLANNINLFAYHLPLDVHSELGNNRQLGELIGATDIKAAANAKPSGVVMHGKLESKYTTASLQQKLSEVLKRSVLAEGDCASPISTVAWCTGGGQNFTEQAVELGVDAFVTGEVSEQTIHTAREMGIAFFAAGHHATERYGVKTLGEHLHSHFGIDVEFIDIDNPA